MDIPLKRCPQCGGQGILKYVKPYHWVECENCGYLLTKRSDYDDEKDYMVKTIVADYMRGEE